MLKNNKGITLIALTITIVLMSIIAGISVYSGTSNITQIRVGKIISNMTLVRTKVKEIYEENQFDNTSLIGAGNNQVYETAGTVDLSETEKKLISNDINTWKWYKWDSEILQEQGLNPNILSNGECFYINYENAEILYSKGTSFDGNLYYSMTGLNYVLQNY